ncbi:MAG: hypothetical protein SGARI_004401 [Bacillariaceae sp.]
MTDENISPYIVRASLGPSDIWLVETFAWRRAWQWLTGKEKEQQHSIIHYKKGDLILWKDPITERVSCKRIVGLPGDSVKRYGEFAKSMYGNRPDLGIVWPSDAKERGLATKEEFMAELRKTQQQKTKGVIRNGPTTSIVVPENHVWLEGDCPLFSVDSRHYGPIPASCITGRLVFRLWPWNREELEYDSQYAYLSSSCWVSKLVRPTPYPTMQAYLGRKFGFYRVPKSSDNRSGQKGGEASLA